MFSKNHNSHMDWTLSARGSQCFTGCIHSTNPLSEYVGFHSRKHWKNNWLQGSHLFSIVPIAFVHDISLAVNFSAFSWA